jgi:hypothetical protein
MKSDGTILTASDFTFNNGNTSTAQDGNDGTITFSCDNVTSDDTRGLVRTFGSSTDHRITAHFDVPALAQTGNDYFSFYSRQASDVHGIGVYPNLAIEAHRRATWLTAPGAPFVSHGVTGIHDIWVRLEIEWDKVASNDDLRFFYSLDGVHWTNIHTWNLASASVTVGLWITNRSGAGFMRGNILSWYEETLTF